MSGLNFSEIAQLENLIRNASSETHPGYNSLSDGRVEMVFALSPTPYVDRASGPYAWMPLEGPTWTRLVALDFEDPTASPSTLRGTVFHVNLDDCPRYVALSYCWGSPVKYQTIKIDGQDAKIPESLHSGLVRFMRLQNSAFGPTSRPYVWADALSINQSPDEQGLKEKQHQVGMMSRIFKQATHVLGDLGDTSKDADNAIAMLRHPALLSVLGSSGNDFIKGDRFEAIGLFHPSALVWGMLMGLIDRPWFHRQWMLQEFALNRSFLFMIGPYLLPASDFEKACDALHRLDQSWQTGIQGIRALKRLRMLCYIRQCYRLSQADSLSEVLSSLCGQMNNLPNLCCMFTDFQVTDPRDRLYALLGITESGHAPLSVSYSENTAGLETRFVRYMAANHLGEYIWYLAAGPRGGSASWAPNLSNLRSKDSPDNVGLAVIESSLFKAGAPSGVPHGTNQPNFGFSRLTNGSEAMTIRGKIVNPIVVTTAECPVEGVFRPDAQSHWVSDFLRWEQETRDLLTALNLMPGDVTVWEPHWTTMTGGRVHGTFSPLDADLSTGVRELQQLKHGALEGGGSQHEQLYRLVITLGQAMLGRRLCVTGNSLIGNIPEAARAGDFIAVPAGARKPIVIRRMGVETYQVVGDCYVHSIMHGEVYGLSHPEEVDITLV